MIWGILLWLVLCFIVAVAANTRNRGAGAWFLLSLIISPLIAVLLLLALPRREPGGISLWRRDKHPDGPIRLTRADQK
jgi:hypothetical protein